MNNEFNLNNIIHNYKVNAINFSYFPKKKNIINYFTEEIFVINLITNKIRRNYIIMLMKKYKINFTLVIVEAIDDITYNIINNKRKLTKSEIGCCLSHIWCLNEIIKNEIQTSLILEDDIVFHKDFKNLFQYIIQKQKYDFLLLGACDFSFSKMNFKNVNDGLYRPNSNAYKVYGAHANYYSLNGAKKMFEISKDVYFFDRNYKKMFEYFNGTSFICYPNLIVSDISTTNNGHKYNFFTSEENYYYSNCFIDFNFQDYNFIYLVIIIKNKSIPIIENESYESYLDKIVNISFKNLEKRKKLKLD